MINAYIYCMFAHDHLRERMGEKVHIISTFVSGQMKEDGEKDICPSKYRHIVQNVNTYLQQDMVSLASIYIHIIMYCFKLIHFYYNLYLIMHATYMMFTPAIHSG